jgi:zinc protease
MTSISRRLALALVLVGWSHVAGAQTADQLVERCLTASGGRAALGKLKTRSTIGTITLSTPAGDVAGSAELLSAAPNKSRSLIKVDLSALGAGMLVLDQRFDGNAGYVLDSLQGNHDITGNQLDNMRAGSFPHPFLTYKEMGATVRLGGREKVGEREAYLLILEPPSGSVVREYIDAETYLPMKVVMKIDVPQVGREVEQTTEFLDYREVDGIKLPFRVTSTSSIQNFTITVTKVEHNLRIDDALFTKPATP